MRKFTKWQIFKVFIHSYSGTIAVIGLMVLALQISGVIWSFEERLGSWWTAIATPILPSVIASVIFYFISYYWPNVHKNKVDAKEIEDSFERLEILNTCTLIALGLGSQRLKKAGRFKYPSAQEMKEATALKTVWDPPYVDCWKDDQIFDKVRASSNWVDYLSVIVNEEVSILDSIAAKVTLHPSMRTGRDNQDQRKLWISVND